jgi:hypothetical protein
MPVSFVVATPLRARLAVVSFAQPAYTQGFVVADAVAELLEELEVVVLYELEEVPGFVEELEELELAEKLVLNDVVLNELIADEDELIIKVVEEPGLVEELDKLNVVDELDEVMVLDEVTLEELDEELRVTDTVVDVTLLDGSGGNGTIFPPHTPEFAFASPITLFI